MCFFVGCSRWLDQTIWQKIDKKLRNLLVSLVYGWLFFGAGKQVSEAFRESDLFLRRNPAPPGILEGSQFNTLINLLVGGFKYLLFSPRTLGKWSNWLIFFKWVATTNLLGTWVHLTETCIYLLDRNLSLFSGYDLIGFLFWTIFRFKAPIGSRYGILTCVWLIFLVTFSR